MRKVPVSLFFLVILVFALHPIMFVQAEVVAFTDGFEDQTFNKWDGNGATNWQIGTTGSGTGGSADPHAGLYDAWADETHDGNLISDSIDLSGVSSVDISLWYRGDDLEDGDLTIDFYDGSYVNIFSWQKGVDTDDTWHNLNIPITSGFWTNDFRIQITAICGKSENAWIDDVVITKVEGGTIHYVYPSQILLLTGNNYRDWTIQRTFSQGMTVSCVSSHIWSLTRTFTQALTFTSNIIADITKEFLQILSLALNLSVDSKRMFAPIRTVAQSITMDLNAERLGAFYRQLSQSLSINFETLITYIAQGGTEYFRTVSTTFHLGLETIRNWNLTRIAETTISIQSSATGIWGELITRIASVLINVTSKGMILITNQQTTATSNLLVICFGFMGLIVILARKRR